MAPNPHHFTTTPPNSPFIELVHEAGDASAVWSIGNHALCKARYIEVGVTPESVTLDFVQEQHPSFDTPKGLYTMIFIGTAPSYSLSDCPVEPSIGHGQV